MMTVMYRLQTCLLEKKPCKDGIKIPGKKYMKKKMQNYYCITLALISIT